MNILKNVGRVALLLVLCVGVYQVYSYFATTDQRVRLNQASVVREINSLARLETASYNIEKIIEAGTNGTAFETILYGDKILLIAHAEIIAGLDVSGITTLDVMIDGSSIIINLPAPQILVSRLDNEKTRVYDRKLGWFTKGDAQLETEARTVAEQSLRKAACDAGILITARDNAEKQLTGMFTVFGFDKVTLNIAEGECK